MKIKFKKMQSNGNDFLITEDKNILNLDPKKLSDRKNEVRYRSRVVEQGVHAVYQIPMAYYENKQLTDELKKYILSFFVLANMYDIPLVNWSLPFLL